MKHALTAFDVAREYFPGKDDDFLESAIWGGTGFPDFWRIPKDGNTPEECFRKQLQELKDRIACGETLNEIIDKSWDMSKLEKLDDDKPRKT